MCRARCFQTGGRTEVAIKLKGEPKGIVVFFG